MTEYGSCIDAFVAVRVAATGASTGDARAALSEVARGPGTELKALLAGWPFYITSSPDCSCNAMADKMDAMGPDWCASPEGMQEILEAMKQNAVAKSIPYVELAAKMLVRRAIRNARGKTKPILP